MKYKTLIEKSSPSPTALAQIEKAIQQIRPEAGVFQEWYQTYAADHKFRLAFDLEQVQTYALPQAKIIEVGAIPLILTVALANLNYEITGLDLAPERFSVPIQTLNLDIRKANIETDDLPVAQEETDLVIFNEVFEHLRINLIDTLQKTLKLLKPGGILLLSTPNLLSFTGYVNLLVYQKGPGNLFEEYAKLEKLGHMGHVREYSVKEVCQFLNRIGFKIDAVVYRGHWKPTAAWKRMLMSGALAVFPTLRPYFSVIARKPMGEMNR